MIVVLYVYTYMFLSHVKTHGPFIVVSTAGEHVPGEHHRHHDPLRRRQRRLRGATADSREIHLPQ